MFAAYLQNFPFQITVMPDLLVVWIQQGTQKAFELGIHSVTADSRMFDDNQSNEPQHCLLTRGKPYSPRMAEDLHSHCVHCGQFEHAIHTSCNQNKAQRNVS